MSRLSRFRATGLLSVVGISLAAAPVLGASSHDSTTATTVSKTITRTLTDSTGTHTVDSRDMTVSVSQTTNLQGRQRVTVSWTGAHPSDNDNYGNAFSGALQQTEYPVVVLECRGVDGATDPSQQLGPQTCWTQNESDRNPDSTRPLWELDADASGTDIAAQVPSPSQTISDDCFPSFAGWDGPLSTYRFLPFVASDGTSYPMCGNQTALVDGPDGTQTLKQVFAEPPEATPGAPTGLGIQEQFVPSNDQGDGSTLFEVRTGEENASLGCSLTVACSLVVVPIEGISCDVTRSAASSRYAFGADGDTYRTLGQACVSTGTHPGDPVGGTDTLAPYGADAVTGRVWSFPSIWKNRISIPLAFSPPPDYCSVVNTSAPEQFYGTELASQLSQQWGLKFCTDPSGFNFNTVSQPEFQARQEVDGSLGDRVAAGFTAFGPDGGTWTNPTVTAPVGVSGFGVGYVMANYSKTTGGVSYYSGDFQTLKLNPRLLAKLITESYNAGFSNHPGVGKNPYGLSQDPEFQALNPDFPSTAVIDPTMSTLLALAPLSDVTRALTSYINADPEARAWLDGTPDPWGMVVNPAYKGIALPVDKLPLLDPTVNPQADVTGSCPQLDEAPYLQEVEAPVSTLATVAGDLLNRQGDVQLGCHVADPSKPGDVSAPTKSGSVSNVAAEMLGIVSLSDAAKFDLPLAQLQTTVDPSVAGTKFTDTTGRTFVAPTNDSLAAAMQIATPDTVGNLWTLDYAKLHTTAQAYPLTTPIYAAVPTSGLSATTAAHVAQFLRYASSSTGQTQGFGPGNLPFGFTPITAADGLGFLADYTNTAADAVAAQQGAVPLIVPAAPSPSSGSSAATASPSASKKASASTKASTKASTSAKATSSPASGGAVGVSQTSVAPPAPSVPASSSAKETSAAASPTVAPAVIPAANGQPTGKTPGTVAGHASDLVALLLLVLLGCGVGVAANTRRGRQQ